MTFILKQHFDNNLFWSFLMQSRKKKKKKKKKKQPCNIVHFVKWTMFKWPKDKIITSLYMSSCMQKEIWLQQRWGISFPVFWSSALTWWITKLPWKLTDYMQSFWVMLLEMSPIHIWILLHLLLQQKGALQYTVCTQAKAEVFKLYPNKESPLRGKITSLLHFWNETLPKTFPKVCE